MSTDQIILQKALEQLKEKQAPTMSADKFFEVFSIDQVLKDHNLSYEEILSGIFDGSDDGGIDWAFVLVNGKLVDVEDANVPEKGDLQIDLFVGQSKNVDTFKETAVDKLKSRLDILLRFEDSASGSSTIKKDLIEFFAGFRKLYLDVAARFPKLTISLCYACKGRTPEGHDKVSQLAESLCKFIKERFANADIKFEFFGARELLALARKSQTTTLKLKLSESPVSSSRETGYIGLVRLADYYAFITDERGNLRQDILEANVRDYQGAKGSNIDIQKTLETKGVEDFWWLNNGITIVADRATEAAKILTIENPYIVNGLQTSREIYQYFSGATRSEDIRNVLVRVIVAPSQEVADRVIRATNNQIAIPVTQLRATEKIHRDIEDIMKSFDLFYDRRRNFYKLQGKPIQSIVTIVELAQSVIAGALGRPADARARPSSLINSDENYARVFNENYPITFYPIIAVLLKRCDAFLYGRDPAISRQMRNNLRFYLLRRVVMRLTKNMDPGPHDIAKIKLDALSADVLEKAFNEVASEYSRLGGDDQVAKGVELADFVNGARL